MSWKWKCQLCSWFGTALLASLLFHIKSQHGTDPNFRVNCCVDNCPTTFVKADSFYRHVRTRHADRLQMECSVPESLDEVGNRVRPQDDQMPQYGSVHETDEDNQPPCSSSHEMQQYVESQALNSSTDIDLAPSSPDSKRRAAGFIFHMKSKCKLTQKSTENFISRARAFHEGSVTRLKRKLQQRLQERGNDFSETDIDEIFELDADPFEELNNAHSFMKYLETFNYVAPVKKVLGKRTIVSGYGPKRKLKEVEDSYYYIPVAESIEKLMQNRRFREEISKDHFSHSPKLCDYCDGESFSKHPFLQKHPRAFQVILYYDDVELCNPLGSKPKIHKMGFFYFTLANINPRYRSKLCSINLMCICPSKYLTPQSYGIDSVLKPIIQEFIELESGKEIMVLDQLTKIHAVVIAFVADTLAAHALGGFKEGVGFSLRKCRNCYISADDLGQLFRPEDFVMRSSAGHAVLCKKYEEANTTELKDMYSTTYGINRRRVLEEPPYFSVVHSLPQDVMHILLEGCLPYTMKQLLKFYIQEEKLFSLSQLNQQIQNFEFGYVDKPNKPTLLQNVLDDDSPFRQSSSQMWVLGRFLPLFIRKFITCSMDDKVWQCYILLLQIMAICFSPVVQHEDLVSLKEIVEYHLKAFKDCFNVNIIPKQHYMCHLSHQIQQYGPLLRFWCMRYEAKHSFFKSHCSIASFKNAISSVP